MSFEIDLICYESEACSSISKDCEDAGWDASSFTSINQFIDAREDTSPPVMILSLPDDLEKSNAGEDLSALKNWRDNHATLQLILIIPEELEDGDRLALKLGARHTLYSPYESRDFISLLSTIAQSFGKRRQLDEVNKRLLKREGFEEIIGVSDRMKSVIELARKVGRSNFTSLMITGENGTGKGVLAQAIHKISDRADGPFIEVNCAAIPKNLLESEFFGYEKGAFTDAKERKLGLFELANGGTIFLDEIGEIDYGLQAKLLKFLDSRTIRRVSGTQFLPVDVRIISATNRVLKDEIESNRFRVDLFYRLNVIEIDIPPLRSRREDIRPLIMNYLKKFGKTMGKGKIVIHEDAIDLLESYSWPGNIRELINMLERAVLLNTDGELKTDDLPIDSRPEETITTISERQGTIEVDLPPHGVSLDEIEKGVISAALKRTGGNVTQAADLLRVERGTLRYKMKKHGIVPSSFKEKPETGEYEPVLVFD
ncbi:MAG: sigma-54-dependent Fis family transcriptional regulator [Candidatus Krumholzibacteria bacterium]|nr:sigma-54-dependent Fis family transcriptional regulator [Candidatus Krumholzibacteria bacterium]